MSRLFYGADCFAFSLAGKLGIELQVCKVVEFRHDPVWDGPTYLWTKFRIHVHAIFNPEATSWIPGGLWAGGDPTIEPQPTVPGQHPSQGVTGALTDIAIRHFLLQPRRQLLYFVEPNIPCLFSPEILFVNNAPATGRPATVPCDSNNGPTPIHCNVTAVKGTKTFMVDFCVETCVNECIYYKSPTLLTVVDSHRWSEEHEIDQDLFTTRIIRGHARFKTDLLNVVQQHPDTYRAFLMHPVPDNFKRDDVRVSINEDDNTLDYTLIDREQAVNMTTGLIALGVTRIEAWFNNGIYDNQSEFDLLHGIHGFGIPVGAAINPAWNFMNWLQGKNSGQDLQREKVLINGKPPALLAPQLAFNIPRQSSQITVRVWGHRLSNRKALYSVAINIALLKLGLDNIQTGTSEISVNEDLMGKFVELRASYRAAPNQAIFTLDNKKGFAAIVPAFPDDLNTFTTRFPSPNQNAPGGRGTYLELATANALQTPCQNPLVPGPRPVVDLSLGDQVSLTTIVGPGDTARLQAMQKEPDQVTLTGGNGLP